MPKKQDASSNPPLTPLVGEPRPLLVGAPAKESDRIASYLGIRETKLKYASLQKRGLIYGHVTPEEANLIIEVLEKTKWQQSDFVRYILHEYIYMNKVGVYNLFAQLHAQKLLESDKIEDLRYIRDNLRAIVPKLLEDTGKLVASFSKHVED